MVGEEKRCIMGAHESLCLSPRSSSEATVETPQAAQRLFQLARSGNVAGMNALKQKCKHLPLNARNEEGQTLLHIAARYGHTEFCRELLRQNLTAWPNKEGQLPKDVALLGGYTECAALFAGANAPVADDVEGAEYAAKQHTELYTGDEKHPAEQHKELYTGDDKHPALQGNALGLGFVVILDGKPGKALFQVKLGDLCWKSQTSGEVPSRSLAETHTSRTLFQVSHPPASAPFPPDLRCEIVMEYHERLRVWGIRHDGWCLVGRVNRKNLHLHQEGWVPGQQRTPPVNPCPLRPSHHCLTPASVLLSFTLDNVLSASVPTRHDSRNFAPQVTSH